MYKTTNSSLAHDWHTDGDVLVKVEGVSKKLCRDLKKSLWYGVKDMASELLPFGSKPLSQTSYLSSGSNNGHASAHNGTTNGCQSAALRPGEFWAVNDVSFELKRGECLGLIGGNGAGKTTLLRMLNGLIKPDTGRIEIRGRMQGLIALGAGFNPVLTGRENIYVNAAVLGIRNAEIDRHFDEIVDFSGVEEFIDSPVQSYSSGMAVRLGFAVAVHMEPDILLVDEVLAVGDLGFQSKCFNKLGQLRAQGVTTILVSHSMMHILGFSRKVLYLSEGKKRCLGDPEESVKLYQNEMNLASYGRNVSSLKFGVDDIKGSGRVRFTAVEFLDKNKAPINRANAKEAFSVRVYYWAIEDIGFAELDIAITGSGGGTFFRASSQAYGGELIIHEGNGYIDANFESLRANNQKLMFSITLWKVGRSELFDWKRELPLFVEGDSRAGGDVLLNVSWKSSVGAYV